MAEMSLDQVNQKIGEAVEKSIAPLKSEIENLKKAGADTAALEVALKKSLDEGEKRKGAAASEWESIFENARANKDGKIEIDAAKMVGKIATAGAFALKETGQRHVNDKQMVIDYCKKMYPNDKGLHEVMQKDMEAGIPSAGGYGIPQVLLPNYVDYLYAKTLLDKLGVEKIPMPNGNFRLARVDATSSFSWGGETPRQQETKPTLGDIVLAAKKGTAIVPVSNSLLRQNAIGIDGLVSRDLQRIATIALDTAAFYGLGNLYQPLGLELTPSIQSIGSSGSPTALTPQFPIDAVALLENANVPMENVKWAFNPLAKSWMMGKAFSTGPFAWANEMNVNKTLDSFPYVSSSTIKNSSTTWGNVWLGDWSEFIWGVSYDIALDISREGSYTDSSGNVYNAFEKDMTLIRLITECDFNVRHPASFVECFVSKGS